MDQINHQVDAGILEDTNLGCFKLVRKLVSLSSDPRRASAASLDPSGEAWQGALAALGGPFEGPPREGRSTMTRELQEVDDMVAVKIVFCSSLSNCCQVSEATQKAICCHNICHAKPIFPFSHHSCQCHFAKKKTLKLPQAKRKTLTEMDQKKSEVVLALWKKISEDTTTVPQLFETMNGRRLRDSC